MNKKWSEVERDFIKQNAGVLTDSAGAAKLSVIVGRPVSVHAWRKQRQKLGLRKSAGRSVCKLDTDRVPAPLVNIQTPVAPPTPKEEILPDGAAQTSVGCDW